MHIDTGTIVVSFITLLFSAIISYLITRHQKQLDYAYDYRKYILEKRKSAYSEIEVVINMLTSSSVEPVTYAWVRTFIVGPDDTNPFYHYNIKIADCLGKGYWLSDAMFNQLKKLHLLMIKMIDDSMPDDGELSYVMTAEKFDQEITSIIKPFADIYFTDICELDNIKKFKDKQNYF